MNLFKHLAVGLFFAVLNCSAQAGDIYISQNSTGSGDGSSAANAQSVNWLNTNVVGAGNTIHLLGTISTKISLNGGGTAGNPVTVYFEPGAKLSQLGGTLVTCVNQSYVVFDGGSNGIIENTDNGVGLGHNFAVSGIYASGCDHLEVKNLTFQNLYVHPPQASNSPQGFLDFGANGAIYMNGFGDGLAFHNNSFSNICWVINIGSGTGSGINIYSNNFVNYDHGATSFGNTASKINIYNNHFGSTATWDTGVNNYYHHDGIHIFFGAGSTLSGVQIYNNLFDGDWGNNNTAHIFGEGDFTHANQNALGNVMIYNNVFVQSAGNTLNNGFISGGGPNWSLLNNTFAGASVYNSSGVTVGGQNLTVKNNIFSGVNTFISVNGSGPFSFDNNVYAKPGPGGNSPWWKGNGMNGISMWRTAVGGDANAILTFSAVINADGTLVANSLAAGIGSALSTLFQTDITGLPRTGAWSVGAYQQSSGTTVSLPIKLSPPQNLHLVQPGKS